MNSRRPELRLDWCSHEAATYAVKHWHYSGAMPTPPYVRIGVWEDGAFRGCILFSRGAARRSSAPFGLGVTEIAELTRVALTTHHTPVSRLLRVAVALVRRLCPGLRLLVSYADPSQGHHGGVYQAAGWTFLGKRPPTTEYITPAGKREHSRMVSPTGTKRVYGVRRAVFRPDQCLIVRCEGKWKYVLPLDDAMRAQIAPLGLPYPKRAKHPADAPADQAGEGGAAPTRTLQEIER